MTVPAGGPLASDADREAAVAELGTHCAAGRLDLAELDRRVALVHRASDLAGVRAVLLDLTGPPPPSGPPYRPLPPPGRLARLRARLTGGPGRRR